MTAESAEQAGWSHETRALYARLIESWDKRNAREFALQFTSDGSLVGFDGSQVNGQLVQGRLGMAILQFVLAIVLWFFLLGWAVHLWSIIDAALWKPPVST